MARMIPTAPTDFHGSPGEARVFRALRSLPDDFVVIHSFRWVHPGNAHSLSRRIGAQGEGDFVLFDPARGVMVVEVKGGRVWCELGEWKQQNRKTGQIVDINPEAQASNTLHRIREDLLAKLPEAKVLLFCYGVWFPDGAVDRAILPMNYHADMVLDGEDIARPDAAIQRCFAYWRARFPGRRGIGANLASKVLNTLAPTLHVVRSLRQTLDEREELMVKLTREQARVLEFLDEQRHAAIIGAAGTGKTLLAVEKARRLASPTQPVLFLCYNSALQEHLDTHHRIPNVRYLTFHGFARELMGPDDSLEAVVTALLERLADDGLVPYDHVVVDEGQDFDEDWLEYLQYRFRNGTFYVYFDRHQAIQQERSTRWLDQVPCRLVLTRNCRNTDPIARVAYRAAGLRQAPTLGIEGSRPVLHRAAGADEALATARRLVESAIDKHKVEPQDVAVLTLETLPSESPWSTATFGKMRTTDRPRPGHVTVSTVRRFKGLEAALVIVVDVDFQKAVDADWRRRLYVACSRARQAVHIITTTQESELLEPLRVFAETDKVRVGWQALARHLGVRLGSKQDDPFNEPEARRI